VAVDRQMVAQTVSQLRTTLPQADDLLARLQRVAEATRRVLEVDGAGLTLVHEDGLPRWVAATDAALELLEQIQHDLGEGPHLQAYAQDQPVGTLDVYSTQPRAWTAHELEAMGEFASVAGELVQTSVQLASRELEVAQLQQALTSRVWTEQAKGVLAATRGTDPEVAFQQLRARARASSRRLAELAREVVQDARRQRLAALALEDVRVQGADLAQRRRA
jgi:hypothetical protein